MPLRLSHSILVAGLLSLSVGGHAQPTGAPRGAPPKQMHEPATRADLKTMLETRFDRRDINHDGKLDQQDPKARRDQHLAAMFDRADADHNGSISKDEFTAARDRRPESPRAGAMRPGRAMMFSHGGPESGRMHRPMRGAFMQHGPMPGGPAGAHGAPITKSDFVGRGLARFDKVDTNHDGKLSAAERDAARGSMRDHRGRATMAPPQPNTPQSGK